MIFMHDYVHSIFKYINNSRYKIGLHVIIIVDEVEL